MNFYPDPFKQAAQILFSRKSIQIAHLLIYFNAIEVKTDNQHKHLGLVLDAKVSFASQINEKISKARKGLDIINPISPGLF